MLVTEIVPPTGLAVSLQELRDQCSLDDDEDDALVTLYAGSARHLAEAETGRQVLPATLEMVLDGFPECREIKIRRPPLIEVLSVKYLDDAGVEQTLAAPEYVVEAPVGERALPGRLRLAYGSTWPTTQQVPRSVRIRFRAGYEVASQLRVPDGIRHAILVGVAEALKNREEFIQGTISTAAAMTMRRLLGPYRVFDFEW